MLDEQPDAPDVGRHDRIELGGRQLLDRFVGRYAGVVEGDIELTEALQTSWHQLRVSWSPYPAANREVESPLIVVITRSAQRPSLSLLTLDADLES